MEYCVIVRVRSDESRARIAAVGEVGALTRAELHVETMRTPLGWECLIRDDSYSREYGHQIVALVSRFDEFWKYFVHDQANDVVLGDGQYCRYESGGSTEARTRCVEQCDRIVLRVMEERGIEPVAHSMS